MQRIAVMGAGAVGSFFGGMLARAGADVTLIARGPHLEALARNGLFIDSMRFQERVPVRASAEAAAVRDAELVLFCVKTTGTASAAQAMAPHLSPGAVVISLQNGVDNAAQIRAAAGIEALASVVYVAASIPEPGRVRHSGRGDLVMGDSGRSSDVARVAATLERAGVPCQVTDNLEGELWQKLMLNCAGNAITALGRAGYATSVRNRFSRRVVLDAEAETRAVARAVGVRLPEEEGAPALDVVKLFESYGSAISSTAQDVARGRHTEIDSLNGYVARRGEELGVLTPVNRTLHALIKLIEESF